MKVYIGTIFTVVLITIVLCKTLIDICIPYVLARQVARGKVQGSFSWFWFVELIPLLGAIISSAAAGLDGLLAPKNIAIAGFCIVCLPFLHLMVYISVIKWLRSQSRQK